MNKYPIILTLCFTLPSVCHATFDLQAWQPLAAINLGPGWNNAGTTQTFYVQSDTEKTYEALPTTHTLGIGEFLIGGQHALNPHFNLQLGLAIAATTAVKLQGNIWEDADPNFNNYSYSYKINPARITVNGRLLANNDAIFKPYLAGSLGLGINRSYGFKIMPKIYEEVVAPFFTSQTVTGFAYTIGGGIQTPLDQHWQVGLGYEFADWGHSQLAKAPGQTLNSGLQLSHLYTNQLQFGLNYMA